MWGDLLLWKEKWRGPPVASTNCVWFTVVADGSSIYETGACAKKKHGKQCKPLLQAKKGGKGCGKRKGEERLGEPLGGTEGSVRHTFGSSIQSADFCSL